LSSAHFSVKNIAGWLVLSGGEADRGGFFAGRGNFIRFFLFHGDPGQKMSGDRGYNMADKDKKGE